MGFSATVSNDSRGVHVMKRKYPVIDMVKTGQNMKRIMQASGLEVKDIQEFLELSTPQSIYHWFDGRNLPTVDNLYALSELFHLPVDALLKGNRKYEYILLEDRKYRRLQAYYERLFMRSISADVI
jgi:transcriptional regulator with XRE-family HTH domain